MNNKPVLDAAGQAFFQRELEYLIGRSYEKKFGELSFRNVLPISTEANPGAETITYQMYEEVGQAKLIISAANDLPRADVTGKEHTVNVRTIGSSFGYTVKAIKSSQMAGKSLDQRKANAARRAVETTMNTLAWHGDDTAGIMGVLSTGNGIPRLASDKPFKGTGMATPQEKLDYITSWFNKIFTDTKMAEAANRIVLTPEDWSSIWSTRFSDGGDRVSLGRWLIENVPFLSSDSDIVAANELIGADSNGKDMAFVMKYDNEVIECHIPEELTFYEPQMKGLEYVVPCSAEFAGLIVPYPMAHLLITGLSA